MRDFAPARTAQAGQDVRQRVTAAPVAARVGQAGQPVQQVG
ncbi:hypothetical protein [Streptomyces sp. NPDC002845]